MDKCVKRHVPDLHIWQYYHPSLELVVGCPTSFVLRNNFGHITFRMHDKYGRSSAVKRVRIGGKSFLHVFIVGCREGRFNVAEDEVGVVDFLLKELINAFTLFV